MPAWLPEFILLAAIWGASFLFMRIGVAELGAFATAGLRVGIAALFLLPLALARGHGAALKTHWKLTAMVGIFNSAIPFVCFSYALLSISTGLSSILNATSRVNAVGCEISKSLFSSIGVSGCWPSCLLVTTGGGNCA